MGSVVFAIMGLLGGIAVFSVGMRMMSDGLKRSCDKSLKRFFSRVNDNRFTCTLIGAGVTALVQSSTATTVMTIGLVSAGAITLFQATAIIMGANIGTTLTGLLVSLSSLPINSFAFAIAFVGSFMVGVFKDELIVTTGTVLCGLGLLFVGLNIMSGALAIEKINDMFFDLFKALRSPILLILAGLTFTAIVQSSSATTGLIIVLAGQGTLPLINAFYLVLGTNVGTCATALIAAVGTGTNARRAAFIHFVFNALGLLFAVPLWLFQKKSEAFFQFIAPDFIELQIAYFNIITNILSAVILLPFIKQMNKLSERVIK